jgi:hypothetical protein
LLLTVADLLPGRSRSWSATERAKQERNCPFLESIYTATARVALKPLRFFFTPASILWLFFLMEDFPAMHTVILLQDLSIKLLRITDP